MFDFLKVMLQQLLPVSFQALARPFHLSLGRTFLVRVVSVTCPDNSTTPSYQPSVYNTSRNLNTKVLDFVGSVWLWCPPCLDSGLANPKSKRSRLL